MIRLGILGSTNGTDVVAIIKAIRSKKLSASIEIIISNNQTAGILEKAKKYNIDHCIISHKNLVRNVFDKQISDKLVEKEVDLVLLIGFMRILSPSFIDAWSNKILNVHPSLLPKYAGGMNNDVHASVLENGDSETGCTIHLVTKDVDKGPIIIQKRCRVFKGDTVPSLKKRVQDLEGEAFIDAINKWGKND